MSAYVFPVAGYTGEVALHWGSVAGGSDLFAPRGTAVLALGAGVIEHAGWSDVGGWNLLLRLDSGLVAYYAHLDFSPLVGAGGRVTAGQEIGAVGNTGNASQTDPHLHIGIGLGIVHGTGPYGGTGGDYDAVGLLQAALAARQGERAMVAIGGFDLDVAEAVIDEAEAQGLPPLLLLALAHGEGGLKRPFPAGDGGKSFGPFQVYTTVHGGTREHWEDPRNAIRLMVGRWKENFARYGGWSAWWYDHYAFIEAWAPAAQGSIAWAADKARQCVGHAWDTYVLVMRERLARAGSAPGRDPALSERVRVLENALTVQAAALDEIAARATIQAANLRSVVMNGGA